MKAIDLGVLTYPGVVVRGELFDSKDREVLLEDLLEVELPNGKFIDLGWYPEHDLGGEYVARLWKSDSARCERCWRTTDVHQALEIVAIGIAQQLALAPTAIDTEIVDRLQTGSSTVAPNGLPTT